MHLIIFERTNFEISEINIYQLYSRVLKNDRRSFNRFITDLCNHSEEAHTYLNVYRVYKDKSIVKIAWIKSGDLYTL